MACYLNTCIDYAKQLNAKLDTKCALGNPYIDIKTKAVILAALAATIPLGGAIGFYATSSWAVGIGVSAIITAVACAILIRGSRVEGPHVKRIREEIQAATRAAVHEVLRSKFKDDGIIDYPEAYTTYTVSLVIKGKSKDYQDFQQTSKISFGRGLEPGDFKPETEATPTVKVVVDLHKDTSEVYTCQLGNTEWKKSTAKLPQMTSAQQTSPLLATLWATYEVASGRLSSYAIGPNADNLPLNVPYVPVARLQWAESSTIEFITPRKDG